MCLSFKFQILLTTEGFEIYCNMKFIEERAEHRDWLHVKNCRSVQRTEDDFGPLLSKTKADW
jgi:hypothetical protein